MSINAVTLGQFLEKIPENSKNFPKNDLNNYCKQHSPVIRDITRLFTQFYQQYRTKYIKFKQIIMIIYVSLLRGFNVLLTPALTLIEDLIRCDLVLLGVQKNACVLINHLMYLQQLMYLLIPALLQNNYENSVLEVIIKNNQKQKVATNSVNILVQMMFIQQIRVHLSESSRNQFDQILKNVLNRTKLRYWNKLKNKQIKVINLNNLVYFRIDEEDSKTYNLMLGKKDKLKKIEENCSKLPEWVKNAYIKPVPVNLQVSKHYKFHQYYKFLLQLQIYASSPEIEMLNDYITDETFLDFFIKFLMGQQLAQRNYQFHCQKLKQYIKDIRSKKEQICQPLQNIIKIYLQKIIVTQED